MFQILLLLLFMLPDSFPCIPTNPGGTPGTPIGCCPALTQTLTPTNLPDGVMTFVYDNTACRRTVVANCASADPAFNLVAGIVANTDNFLEYNQTAVSYPGTCNNGAWFMGTPLLQVNTLECILTNPP